jgi:hypothetical protein
VRFSFPSILSWLPHLRGHFLPPSLPFFALCSLRSLLSARTLLYSLLAPVAISLHLHSRLPPSLPFFLAPLGLFFPRSRSAYSLVGRSYLPPCFSSLAPLGLFSRWSVVPPSLSFLSLALARPTLLLVGRTYLPSFLSRFARSFLPSLSLGLLSCWSVVPPSLPFFSSLRSVFSSLAAARPLYARSARDGRSYLPPLLSFPRSARARALR